MDTEFLLKRAVAEVISEEELRKMLKSGKKLRLKEGLDPSSPDIHIGHMVGLRKLRQFQELGHQVVLIVGDWTARIGDPSGASITRPMLTAEQVMANAQTYMDQFFMVVDKDKTEVRLQSEWFDKFTLETVIRLTSKFTVAQFLAREDFNNRFKAQKPIAITEFMYPLMQAYDSVAIEADVEFGGTDQKFNFLVGRELQGMMGQKPQQCFMTPMLVGTDGNIKMSKSLGNYIGIAEPPPEIFGKVMSVKDELIGDYFELVTDVPDKDLAEIRHILDEGKENPMELKKRLAREIITQLYGAQAATDAEAHFARVVQRREIPDDIPEYRISFKDFEFLSLPGHSNPREGYDISRILGAINMVKSRSEAFRLISQGAVSIDGKVVASKLSDNSNVLSIIAPRLSSGSIIKVGKRRYARVINSDT